jgi:2',3'-cyclic-nucleotide 2'-phosphodiesterase (5'-nucleotidase family)
VTRLRPCLSLLLAALCLAPLSAQERQAVELTILHTNDIHGQVMPREGSHAGLVGLGRAIRQHREAALRAGRAVLLLDAGDFYKGTPEGDLTDGEVVVAWMNHLGYDALAIGNHEFDHGLGVVEKLAAQANFPILGANVVDDASGQRPVWLGKGQDGALRGAAVVKEVAPGVKVAVVGVTTRLVKEFTVEGVTDGVTFTDEAAAIETVLAALPPVQCTVLVSHCGLETDRLLAKQFEGRIDVILSGHDHKELPQGEVASGVLLAETGGKASWLGTVQVTIPAQGEPSASARLVQVGDDFEAVLEPYVAKVGEIADQPVGELLGDLGTGEDDYVSSPLGNLQTDLMRAAAGADVAFQNKSGIRKDLLKGPISYRNIYEVSPFGNTVVKLRLKGSDLRELLEGMLDASFRLLEMSGARIEVDPSKPVGKRLVKATVGGEPLDPERLYLVATNNFLAPGGDGHDALGRGTDRVDTGVMIRDLLRKHLTEHSPFDPGQLDARITKVRP